MPGVQQGSGPESSRTTSPVYFDDIPMLAAMVERETAQGFELSNRVDIAVATNSFRAVRGRPILCAIFDEVAFWRDDASATPDIETYNAVKPGLATMPGSMIVGICSPYRKSGLLHKKYKDAYGKPGRPVIKAPTAILNPTIDPAIIAAALDEDPAPARGPSGWRSSATTSAHSRRGASRPASPPRSWSGAASRASPTAFGDPCGGAASSMTLAIGHAEHASPCSTRSESAAPFSPDDAVAELPRP